MMVLNPTWPVGVNDPDTFDLPGVSLENQPKVVEAIRALLSKWIRLFSAHDHDFGLCTVESLHVDLTSLNLLC